MSVAAGRRPWRDLWKRRDGAAALEFAIVCIPFFWLIFGMAEFGAMSLAQSNLDNALSQVGRQIRTGAAQGTGMTKSDLENRVCTELNRIMTLSCSGSLFLDVDRYNSFANVGNAPPTNNGAIDQGQLNYAPGGPDEVILVRAYYQWKIFTPFFGAIFANMQDGKRLVVSSMLFRNEPF